MGGHASRRPNLVAPTSVDDHGRTPGRPVFIRLNELRPTPHHELLRKVRLFNYIFVRFQVFLVVDQSHGLVGCNLAGRLSGTLILGPLLELRQRE